MPARLVMTDTSRTAPEESGTGFVLGSARPRPVMAGLRYRACRTRRQGIFSRIARESSATVGSSHGGHATVRSERDAQESARKVRV